MKCGQCGADIMLGAAACDRCGWSPLGAAPVAPAEDLGGGDPFVGGDAPGPAFAPPPPPPPGYAPPAPGSLAAQVAPATSTPKPVPPQGGCSGGGCLGLIVLIAVAALGAGIFAAVRGADVEGVVDDVRDAVEIPGSDEGFDGDRVDGPAVAVGSGIAVQTLGTGDVAVHRFDGAVGTVTIRAVGIDGFDPFIRVESADGDVLDEDDDGGDGTDSLLTIDLSDEPGAVLLVRHFAGRPGAYSLFVLEGDGTAAPTTGAALAVGSPTGGVVAGRDHVVSHPFAGTGAAVSITVAGISGLDPVVTVVDAAGSQLATNDDFGAETGRDARVDLTIAAGTTVTVQVSGFGSSSGPYLVTVEPVG